MRIAIPLLLILTPACSLAAQAKSGSAVKLPAGAAMDKVRASCSGCHGLDQVTGAHKTEKQWEVAVNTMVDRGAKVADADFDAIVDYLAKNFGPARN